MRKRSIYCDIDGTLNDNPTGGGKAIPSRVNRIKELISMGHEVILWSAGGAANAEQFAKANGINAKYYLTKPHIVIDDNPRFRPRGWQYYTPEDYFEPKPVVPPLPKDDILPDSKFYIPETFKFSDLAPTRDELKFIHDWLVVNKIGGDVLEFGCGITSWAVNLAVKPKNYFALETHPGCLASMNEHLPNVKIIATTWDDIPRIPFGVIFVDSSVGRPAGGDGIYRDEAAKYGIKLASNDAVVILHDVNMNRRGYQNTIKAVLAEGFKEIARFKGRTGVGIYRR